MLTLEASLWNLDEPGFIPTAAALRKDELFHRVSMSIENPALASDLVNSIGGIVKVAKLDANQRYQLALIGPAGVRRYDLGPPSMDAAHLAPWRALVQERRDFLVVVMRPVEDEYGEASSRAIHIQTVHGEAMVEVPCIEFDENVEFALARARLTSLTGEFARLPCFFGRRDKGMQPATEEQMKSFRELDFNTAAHHLAMERRLTLIEQARTVH